MKRFLATATAGMLVFCVLGSGCSIHQSFSNLVPEEYGAWENYYIYHGNVRSKTTGENAELLVTMVEVDGEEYTVTNCADSDIFGDTIYMCLNLAVPNAGGKLQMEALVEYDLKTKEQALLMTEHRCETGEEGLVYEYHPYSVEMVTAEGLVVYGQRATMRVEGETEERVASETVYFSVGLDGTFVGELAANPYGYIQMAEGQFLQTVTSSTSSDVTLTYLTWGMDEGVPIYTYDNDKVYVETEFVNEGSQGFLLKTYALEELGEPENYYGDKLRKVEFFDLSAMELTCLYEGDSHVEWVGIPENRYFITYDYEEISYQYRSGLFQPVTEGRATIKKNCVVYRIDYTAEGATANIAYTFDEKYGLSSVAGVDATKNLYLQLEWYESAGGLSNGGRQAQAYKVEVCTSNGKMSAVDDEEWRSARNVCYGTYQAEVGVTFGQYAYYIEAVKLNTVLDRTSYAYSLYRYDTSQKKTEVMQLWASTDGYEGEKYCRLMWKENGGSIYEFAVRNY